MQGKITTGSIPGFVRWPLIILLYLVWLLLAIVSAVGLALGKPAFLGAEYLWNTITKLAKGEGE